MFRDKTKDEILELFSNVDRLEIINYNKNDIIAIEGAPCTSVGLILDGHIDIKKIINSNTTVHLSSFYRGHLFGEIVAFSDVSEYPATIIAASSSVILFVPKKAFIEFCITHPDFLDRFLNDLTNKILTLNKTITNLSFSSIRQKISNYLLTEYKIQNTNFIKISMTKQKLSESLGIPRPSLSRELKNMKELGIIDFSKDFIKLINIEELENIVFE